MKKSLVFVLLLLAIFSISACSDESKKKEKDSNPLSLIKEGTLSVCADIPYAPFAFKDGANFVGIDVDLVIHMADHLELDAKFIDVDFNKIFQALDDGKCDLIASAVSITDERKKVNNFSDPYYEVSQSILVTNSNSEVLTDLDKLKGKVVGVQLKTTGEEFVNENSATYGYSARSFGGTDELFLALKKGEIDAIIQDDPINRYQSETTGLTKVTKVFDA